VIPLRYDQSGYTGTDCHLKATGDRFFRFRQTSLRIYCWVGGFTKEVMDVAKIELPAWRCERCGHEWVARQEWADQPRVCPKCKSPYWNLPRKVKKDDKKEAEE
jgi:hypothetical protein